MSNQSESVIRAGSEAVAQMYGDTFQWVRPDYTNKLSPETSQTAAIKYRLDPEDRFIEQRIIGVNYFQVVGNRSIQLGDVLIPASGNQSLPITLVSAGKAKPFYGMLTDKIGRITDGKDDSTGLVYDNVRFSFFSLPTAGDGLDSTLLGSLGASVQRVVMYNRPGINEGMWLRWTDPGSPGRGSSVKAVRITASFYKGYQLQLNITDNPGG